MKRLLILLLLAIIGYGGYYYFQQSWAGLITPPPKLNLSDQLVIRQTNLSDLGNVLGVATGNLLQSGKNLLNTVTDGEGEPLINKTVNDLKNQIQDLPQEQYDNVKYEFCKDVVKQYESPAPSINN